MSELRISFSIHLSFPFPSTKPVIGKIVLSMVKSIRSSFDLFNKSISGIVYSLKISLLIMFQMGNNAVCIHIELDCGNQSIWLSPLPPLSFSSSSTPLHIECNAKDPLSQPIIENRFIHRSEHRVYFLIYNYVVVFVGRFVSLLILLFPNGNKMCNRPCH